MDLLRKPIGVLFPDLIFHEYGEIAAWANTPGWRLVNEADEILDEGIESLLLGATSSAEFVLRQRALASYIVSQVAFDSIRGFVEAADMRLAGFGSGQLSALAAAGVYSFGDGLNLVVERVAALEMAMSEKPGMLAAIMGLDNLSVETACSRVDGDVWISSFPSQGQVIIGGAPLAVIEAGDRAKELGAKRVMLLEQFGALNTPYMLPVRDRVRKVMRREWELADAQSPICSSVDAHFHSDATSWKQLVHVEVTNPVHWHKVHEALVDGGCGLLLAVGSGQLAGYARRTRPPAEVVLLATPDDLADWRDRIETRQTEEGRSAHREDSFTVFCSDEVTSDGVVSAAEALAELLGYGTPFDISDDRGSRWRRWRAKAEAVIDEETRKKVLHSLELATLRQKQAEVDALLANAASQLIAAIGEQDHVVVRLGSILILKSVENGEQRLVVHELTTSQIDFLETYPEIERYPSKLLGALSIAAATNSEDLDVSLLLPDETDGSAPDDGSN